MSPSVFGTKSNLDWPTLCTEKLQLIAKTVWREREHLKFGRKIDMFVIAKFAGPKFVIKSWSQLIHSPVSAHAHLSDL
jgi:hypothetical protein